MSTDQLCMTQAEAEQVAQFMEAGRRRNGRTICTVKDALIELRTAAKYQAGLAEQKECAAPQAVPSHLGPCESQLKPLANSQLTPGQLLVLWAVKRPTLASALRVRHSKTPARLSTRGAAIRFQHPGH